MMNQWLQEQEAKLQQMSQLQQEQDVAKLQFSFYLDLHSQEIYNSLGSFLRLS